MKITKKELSQLVTAIANKITEEEERVFVSSFPSPSPSPRYGYKLDQSVLRAAIRRGLRNVTEITDFPFLTAVTNTNSEPLQTAASFIANIFHTGYTPKS
jgi:hypothetical protein